MCFDVLIHLLHQLRLLFRQMIEQFLFIEKTNLPQKFKEELSGVESPAIELVAETVEGKDFLDVVADKVVQFEVLISLYTIESCLA